MLRKTTTLVILWAFCLSCLTGCSSTKTVAVDYLAKPHETKSGIVGAVLESGTVIRFAEEGGQIDLVTGEVFGRQTDGSDCREDFIDVSWLKVRKRVGRTDTVVTVAPESFVGNLENESPHIASLALTSGDTLLYDKDGGQLGLGGSAVIGQLDDGTWTETPLGNIQTAVIKRLSIIKTSLLFLGSVGALIGILALISTEDMTKGGPPAAQE